MQKAGNFLKQITLLSAHLASVRESDQNRYGHFFEALGARVKDARAAERKQERWLARGFNALDYLRTDELGLSRIVGDLLDPDGPHGQGTRFLARFGDRVGPDRWPADQTVPYDDYRVNVVRERRTDGGGRLDISVELRAREHEPACIAFENKPYAGDADRQVADYLSFLRTHYCRRFLLIYLSGHGGMPSRESLPEDACKDGLAIMSYCPREATDDCEASLQLRLPFSLADWLQDCRQECDADRVSWFLDEVERFCHKTFGGSMTTTGERKEVREFILASEDNARTAMAVFDTWLDTIDEVAGRYLGTLRERIDDDLRAFGEWQTAASFGRSGDLKNGVRAWKKAWSEAGGAIPRVCLTHERRAEGWYLGVGLDTSGADANAADLKDRLRNRLAEISALRGNTTSHSWPWYRYLDEYRNWGPLLVRLHKETHDPGELTKYFSGQLVEAAKLADPIIDEVLAER